MQHLHTQRGHAQSQKFTFRNSLSESFRACRATGTKVNSRAGFSLMEILVASAVLITIVVGVVGALRLYAAIATADAERTQASLLVQEAAEALQVMRDAGWSTEIAPLTDGTDYYLYWNGSVYSATTTEIVSNSRFVRTLVFDTVSRDGNDTIVESGLEDANTKLVHVSVMRSTDDELLVESEFLLHNLYEE